jgi:hypothetical protein
MVNGSFVFGMDGDGLPLLEPVLSGFGERPPEPVAPAGPAESAGLVVVAS